MGRPGVEVFGLGFFSHIKNPTMFSRTVMSRRSSRSGIRVLCCPASVSARQNQSETYPNNMLTNSRHKANI